MNAVEVMPEHLFLGVLAQDGDEVAEIFRTLRLNQEVLRTQLATLFPPHNNEGQGDARSVPLSREAHACIEWAFSFATHLHVSSVQLEHVLLGCMRHQHLHPLLAFALDRDASGNGDTHCVGALPSPCAGSFCVFQEKERLAPASRQSKAFFPWKTFFLA